MRPKIHFAYSALGIILLAGSLLFYAPAPQHCVSFKVTQHCGCAAPPPRVSYFEKIRIQSKSDLDHLDQRLTTVKTSSNKLSVAQITTHHDITWQEYVYILDLCRQQKPADLFPADTNIFVAFNEDSGRVCFTEFLYPILETPPRVK